MRHLLKIRDVADLTGVGYNTVIEWVKAGLPTIRPVGRRSHLIDPSDLEAFLQDYKSSHEQERQSRCSSRENWHPNWHQKPVPAEGNEGKRHEALVR
jgi:excisionase family DNA binding protein